MKRKKVTLIVNPRGGQNITHLAGVLAVFAAAGWKTTLALKEYRGHTMALARKAAEDGADLIVAFGGDGTLNQVINGIARAEKQPGLIGLIPGGTANVWAHEVGVPTDPVLAALALLESEARQVDIGHVIVEGLTLPEGSQAEQPRQGGQLSQQRRKASARVRHRFVLMAGLGIDAAVMEQVSKPLKERAGVLAVGVSAAKALPEQHPFPVEIRGGDADETGISWKGEALQIVIGNTRLYADMVQMTPEAQVDDGRLDVCVISAGNPLTTLQQMVFLVLRRHPDDSPAEYFQGGHFSISVPASVALQLDGSAVKLKRYLNKPARQALAQLDESEQALVTYHFNVLPRAVALAIPRTYSGPLFKATDTVDSQQAAESAHAEAESGSQAPEQQRDRHHEQEEQKHLEQGEAQLKHGYRVEVIGVSRHPEHKKEFIIAGTLASPRPNEVQPVALRINQQTLVREHTGKCVSPEELARLRTGSVIVVEGKKGKRGVIRATQVMFPGQS